MPKWRRRWLRGHRPPAAVHVPAERAALLAAVDRAQADTAIRLAYLALELRAYRTTGAPPAPAPEGPAR